MSDFRDLTSQKGLFVVNLAGCLPFQCCLTSPGGPLLQSLSGSTEPHIALRLSSDGKHLISIGEENEMLIWDVRAGRLIRTIDCPGKIQFQAYSELFTTEIFLKHYCFFNVANGFWRL